MVSTAASFVVATMVISAALFCEIVSFIMILKFSILVEEEEAEGVCRTGEAE